jgi:hypothetical protein
VLFHQSGEFQLRKMLQQLIKQAHCLYHRPRPEISADLRIGEARRRDRTAYRLS